MTLEQSPPYMSVDEFAAIVKGKNVIYIATTYLDYIRVAQEIKFLNLHVKSLKILVFKNNSYVLRLLKLYFYILFNRMSKYDVVFFGFSPQLVLPMLKFKFSRQIIISDFFISVYDTFVNDRKKFSKRAFVSKLFKCIDRKTIEYSDYIVADTQTHAKYFTAFGAKFSRTVVMYLQADDKYYFPREQNKPFELQDKYIVMYFASVLPLQGVDVVVNAMDRLSHIKGIHFIVVGPLSDVHKETILSLPSVSYHKWLAQDLLSDLIASADLCLAGHFNGEIKKAKRTIPGKAYIFESMDKMMVLGDSPANKERYPSKYSKVLKVPMSSPELLADLVKQCYEEYAK